MTQWVVVVGGTNMDVVARTAAPLVPGTSNPGHTRISPGGVGRNIAACLGLLGAPVRLVSAVGDDAFGDEVLRVTAACGADVGAVRRAPGATGTYTAVLDDRGELVAAVSDMEIIDQLELDVIHLADAALVVVDGNLAHGQAARVVQSAATAGVPLAFEPVSVAKAERLADLVHDLFLVTPNADELAALTGRPLADWRSSVGDLHARGVEHVWLRHGRRGVVDVQPWTPSRAPAGRARDRRRRDRGRRRDARRVDLGVAARRRCRGRRARGPPRGRRDDREPAHRPARPGRRHVDRT